MINNYGKSTFEEHERLVSFLDTMAVMLGCAQTLESQLPDTRRPDVIRFNVKNKILFIGDAKNTELPNSTHTRERLNNYVRWTSSFILTNIIGKQVVFGICHNKSDNAYIWLSLLLDLFTTSNILPLKYGVEKFDRVTYIDWIQVRS